jgi:hypothetical protein
MRAERAPAAGRLAVPTVSKLEAGGAIDWGETVPSKKTLSNLVDLVV